VKQVFWLLCAIIVLVLTGGSLASVSAQTPTATPDPFTVQLTSTPTALFNSVVSDISANGRFVVFT
jgi:predicted lysophospholipase L1 biosynthesis ABC-type transport system permease subunit